MCTIFLVLCLCSESSLSIFSFLIFCSRFHSFACSPARPHAVTASPFCRTSFAAPRTTACSCGSRRATASALPRGWCTRQSSRPSRMVCFVCARVSVVSFPHSMHSRFDFLGISKSFCVHSFLFYFSPILRAQKSALYAFCFVCQMTKHAHTRFQNIPNFH